MSKNIHNRNSNLILASWHSPIAAISFIVLKGHDFESMLYRYVCHMSLPKYSPPDKIPCLCWTRNT